MENLQTESVVLATQGGHLLSALNSVASEGERSGVSSPTNTSGSIDQSYLEGLLREREAIGIGSGMDLTRRLVNQEIERIQNGGKMVKNDEKRMSDVTKDKSIKLTVKVLVPVKDHPKFNFVGKLLGPKGNSLKRLQEETMTKMAILGRGSMRDKQKEEELRLSGDQKFNHLSEDLHVEVAAVAPPAEAHARIAYALTELRRYLVPDYNDEIRQEQMREMQIINSSSTAVGSLNGSTSSVNNGGAVSGSEEGSCSPNSSHGGSADMHPCQNNNNQMDPHINVGRKISSSTSCSSKMSPNGGGQPTSSLTSSHPALRGLNRMQTAMINTNKDSIPGTKSAGSVRVNPGGGQGTRRSVLSLLTKARAIQQKEHEFMGVFHDMSSYTIYDHMGELPVSEQASDDLTGRSSGALKVTTSPTERARFRHDPYPRIASST